MNILDDTKIWEHQVTKIQTMPSGTAVGAEMEAKAEEAPRVLVASAEVVEIPALAGVWGRGWPSDLAAGVELRSSHP